MQFCLKYICATFLILLINLTATAYLRAINADDVTGVWLTGNKKARIEIYKKNGLYNGKIIWLNEPVDPKTKQPKKDDNNPNTAKRDRPILGLEILQGFKWDASDNEWDDGTIYDPESGKTYSCYMKLKDYNTLDVRGYIGVSWLGRTDTWTRYK